MRATLVIAIALCSACSDKVTHEHLDDWMQTENGPDKLFDALTSSGLDPDLSAHAAENLLLIRMDNRVRDGFAKLSPERAQVVTGKLAPRLWELARIEGENAAPNPQQIAAKDLLFDIRSTASDADRATIDGYLVEWYTSGYYEARADAGRWSGAQVMRAIGPAASKGMQKAANAIVGAPPTATGQHLKVGDKLLLGLAVTGDPEAVRYVCDLTGHDKEKIDPDLPKRAMQALYLAYAAPPDQLFQPADPAGLAPCIPVLGKIVLDTSRENEMVNDAVDVLVAAGPPACLEPLIAMETAPHNEELYIWTGAQAALKCGGPSAIAKVAEAFPQDGNYDHGLMESSIAAEIAKMPKDQAAAAARGLLDDKSWVARWVGVEALGRVGGKDDAAKLDALAKDRAPLHGYWGKDSLKADPTVGQRAAEVAKTLAGS